MNKYFSLKYISFIFKVIIVATAGWYLYKQLFVKNDIREMYFVIEKAWTTTSFGLFSIIVCSLMLVNWSIEAIKWKMMIAKYESITFFQSLEAVFSGVTLSFFTPNRVGEFAGRIFFLEKADRINASLISILGSMSQLLITLVAGGISLIFFLKLFENIEPVIYYSIVFLLLVFIIGITFIYFNINVFHSMLVRLNVPVKFAKIAEVLELFSPLELAKVLSLSAFRYIIFTSQFLLLLKMMDVQTSLPETVIMISMTYLVMAIPTFALAEFGIRSVVALQFIGMLSTNGFGIVTSSFLLYIINVAIPAILGAVFVFNFKFFRNKK